MKHYIYKITCIPTNKVYIGQTNNKKRRMYEHKYDLRHNKHYCTHMQHCFNKYGERNFKFEIIEECEKENVDKRERYWIAFYKSTNKEYGFNSESGESKFKTISEEHKKKISAKVSGKKNPMYGTVRRGKDAPFYGKHLSEEAKKILSEKAKVRYKTHSKFINSEEAIKKRSISNTGKKRSEEFKMKMSEIAKSRTGEKSSFYGKKHSDITKAKISQANKGGTGGGKPKKKIVATHIETGETKIFNSICEASKNGFPSRTLIGKVIKGEYKQYNGYTFNEIIS